MREDFRDGVGRWIGNGGFRYWIRQPLKAGPECPEVRRSAGVPKCRRYPFNLFQDFGRDRLRLRMIEDEHRGTRVFPGLSFIYFFQQRPKRVRIEARVCH